MYITGTGLALGFHGTDQSVVDSVIRGNAELTFKENPYDWLGNGIYFWDNSPSRALEWAIKKSKQPDSYIKKPAVVGAIIELGKCLDLLDYNNIGLLKPTFEFLRLSFESATKGGLIKEKMPINSGGVDFLKRELDCAVIETLHTLMRAKKEIPFDSVRGAFWEGKPIYDTAGFKEKSHIQICIRNIKCIKGYFLPLDRVSNEISFISENK